MLALALGLLIRKQEPGSNMTQMHFMSLYDQLFSTKKKTAGKLLFGLPCDIIGGITSTDPSQVIDSSNRETANLFLNGILLYV